MIDVKVSWRNECSNPDSAKPEVVAAADYGWVRVEVRDSGPGISLLNQQKLFNSIVQFNPKLLQDGGGSGIGLWVSKGIIDLHGGIIGVESQGEGFGSTFFFEIPALKTDYNPSLDGPLHIQCLQRAISSLRCDQVSSMGMAVSVSTDSALLQLHALIVDDSRLCRTMLRRILSDVCDVMDEAADGNEAGLWKPTIEKNPSIKLNLRSQQGRSFYAIEPPLRCGADGWSHAGYGRHRSMLYYARARLQGEDNWSDG